MLHSLAVAWGQKNDASELKSSSVEVNFGKAIGVQIATEKVVGDGWGQALPSSVESMEIMQKFGSKSEVVRWRGLSTTFRFLTVLRKNAKQMQAKIRLQHKTH